LRVSKCMSGTMPPQQADKAFLTGLNAPNLGPK
jgi:hypothetical protein